MGTDLDTAGDEPGGRLKKYKLFSKEWFKELATGLRFWDWSGRDCVVATVATWFTYAKVLTATFAGKALMANPAMMASIQMVKVKALALPVLAKAKITAIGLGFFGLAREVLRGVLES